MILKHHSFRLIDRAGAHEFATQAHNGDVNAVAVGKQQSLMMIASCGRDRTVQVFLRSDTGLDLLQTLDDHSASVTDLMFSEGNSRLFSIAADRTISIWKRCCRDDGWQAYVPNRVISLKSSPVSIADVPDGSGSVLVSTLDRRIQLYSASGQLLKSFKVSDSASSETMTMGSLEIHDLGNTNGIDRVIVGVSSADRSIRIHDFDSGSLLAKEHGHTSISIARLIKNVGDPIHRQHCLVSCGFDGIVMIWHTILPNRQLWKLGTSLDGADSSFGQGPTSARPARRVLSKTMLSSLQGSPEKSSYDELTSTRKVSPACSRRQTTRLSLASTEASPRSANAILTRKSPLSPSPKCPSPKNAPLSKDRRPLLDSQRRTKSTANLNDLNDEVCRVSQSLRDLRGRITQSAVDKVDVTKAQELESELQLMTCELTARFPECQRKSETVANDVLDVYLSRLIDERLAIRAESPNSKLNIQGINRRMHVENEDFATAGAKTSTLEST